MDKKIRFITTAAVIAALYVTLGFVSHVFGLSSGVIQLRLAEALCVLPALTPAAIPGLTLGCLIFNTLTGAMLPDIIFGSLATLAAAVPAYFFRRIKPLVPLYNVITNTAVVPLILAYVYHAEGSLPYFFLTVGAGELLSSYVLGLPLLYALDRRGKGLLR